MSDSDDENLILELIRRIDSKLDALDARLDSFGARFDTAGERLTESIDSLRTMLEAHLAARERMIDDIEDLRRTIEENHAELIRVTGGRVRRVDEGGGSPPADQR